MQCGIGVVGHTGLAETFLLTRYVPVPAVLRFASLPMVTGAGDVPASTFIDQRMDVVELRSGLSRGSDGRFDGLMEQSAADIELSNADGELDALPDGYVFRDRPVTIRAGRAVRGPGGRELAPPLSQFATMFEGRLADIRIDRNRVVLRIEDRLKRLERLVQQEVYQGHGGRNGGPDLAGQRPPLCYGPCFNISPVLVDALRGIYQVHDGEVLRISAVKDRGSRLTILRDVASYAELEALVSEGESEDWDIGRGQVVTCRAEGFFRIGGAANGIVTADVEGDGINDGPVPFDGGALFDGGVGFDQIGDRVHSRYAGGISYRLLVTRLGYLPSEVSVDRLAQYDAENPFVACLFVGPRDQTTGREAIRRLAESSGGVFGWTDQGQAALEPLTGPAPGTNIELSDGSGGGPGRIVAIDVVPLPYGAPWGQVRVRRSRNWTVMTEDQVAADVPAAERDALLSAGAWAELHDARTLTLFPDREPLELDGLLVDDFGALQVAQRLQALYAPGRLMVRATVLGMTFRIQRLSTVRLRHRRYGLAAGRLMLVVGRDERPAAHQTDLLLFG